LFKDIAGHVNTARLALIFDTRCNVNIITEDVVAVDNDVSDVDTDAKANSRLSTARAALRLSSMTSGASAYDTSDLPWRGACYGGRGPRQGAQLILRLGERAADLLQARHQT
jgi:hypothetical protein